MSDIPPGLKPNVKGQPRRGGRVKGQVNHRTKLLKDAIMEAAEAADPEGLVGYLKKQAQEEPRAFLPLLGKVLPMQMIHEGEMSAKVEVNVIRFSDVGDAE